MAVIYRCDHCDGVLEEREKRSTNVGNRNFELCRHCKQEFEKYVQEFFHVPERKPLIINERKAE